MNRADRWLGVGLASLLICGAGEAAGQPAGDGPPGDAPVVVGVGPADAASDGPPAPATLSPEARAALDLFAAARFAEAAAAFDALAGAPDPATRAWSAHLAMLSRRWDGRRLVAIRADGDQPSAVGAGRSERTTGEMAVLYADGVLYGLGTGLYISVLTDPDSAAGVILPSLALAGGVAGGLALADSRSPFSYGVPRSISAGLRLGLLQGGLWTAWNQAQSTSADEWSAEGAATVVWGVTTVGAVVGGLVGERLGATPGAASMVESSGLWSALVGGLLALAATSDLESGEADDIFLLTAAVALNVGAAGGAFLAADTEPSAARVRYLDLGALSGGLLFGGLYVALADSSTDSSALAVTTAFGIATGIGAAWYLTGDMKRDPFDHLPSTEVSLNVAPTPDGVMIGLGGRWY